MATAPRQQAARSRAPNPRRTAAAERSVGDDGQATEEQQGRVRSTTGDLLNLVEQLSNFDQIGVTRLARHLEVPVPTAYRMLRTRGRLGPLEEEVASRLALNLLVDEAQPITVEQAKARDKLWTPEKESGERGSGQLWTPGG